MCRPLNCAITALVVVAGAFLAHDSGLNLPGIVYWAALSAALVAAGGNALNDVYDYRIDKINRTDRPLPSGRIDRFSAVLWGIFLQVLGAATAYSLNRALGSVAVAVILILWLYSSSWKHVALAGNILIAACGALSFLYGAIAVSNPGSGLIPAVFAFLVHSGREIVKDAEDLRGDRLAGSRTLPVVIGSVAAQRVAALILIILVLSTAIPYQAGWYGKVYFMTVCLFVDAPLLIIIVYLVKGLDRRGLGWASLGLKIIMLTGLVSLYAGRF